MPMLPHGAQRVSVRPRVPTETPGRKNLTSESRVPDEGGLGWDRAQGGGVDLSPTPHRLRASAPWERGGQNGVLPRHTTAKVGGGGGGGANAFPPRIPLA